MSGKEDTFNETLKRMMEKDPKPQEEMKKGREQKPAPQNAKNQRSE